MLSLISLPKQATRYPQMRGASNEGQVFLIEGHVGPESDENLRVSIGGGVVEEEEERKLSLWQWNSIKLI